MAQEEQTQAQKSGMDRVDFFDVLDGIGELTGYPVRTAKQIGKGIIIAPEEPVRGVGMALGWTEKTMEDAFADKDFF